MSVRAILVATFAVAARCASGYEPERAGTYFADELAECGAWFMLVAESPGLDAVATIKFRAAGLSLVSSAADIKSEDWALSRMDVASKAMRREMDHSWKNFSVVNTKYGQRCRDVAYDPVKRRTYWLNRRD